MIIAALTTILCAAVRQQDDLPTAMDRVATLMDGAVLKIHEAGARDVEEAGESLDYALDNQRKAISTIDELINRLAKSKRCPPDCQHGPT